MSEFGIPEDFGPLISRIEERKPLIAGLVDNLTEEIELLKTHPLCPPPPQLIKSLEEHVRDHKIIRRRWEIFVEKIRYVKTEGLSAADKKNIGLEFGEILAIDKSVKRKWGDISYELKDWRDSLSELTSMIEDYDLDDEHYDLGEDFDDEEDFADDDTDF